MVEHYTAPINHSTASAAASTTAGAAKGGFWGALKGIGVIAGVGAFLGLAISSVLTGAIALPAFSGLVLSGAMGNALIIAGSTVAGGLLAGIFGAPIGAGIGGIIGGVKGGSKAHDQVNQERGAAAAIQAQIDMVRAANPAVQGTTIYAPSATNDNTIVRANAFPDQALAAAPGMHINSIQYDGQGLGNGQQLAATQGR